jgi:hypothetical protein
MKQPKQQDQQQHHHQQQQQQQHQQQQQPRQARGSYNAVPEGKLKTNGLLSMLKCLF